MSNVYKQKIDINQSLHIMLETDLDSFIDHQKEKLRARLNH